MSGVRVCACPCECRGIPLSLSSEIPVAGVLLIEAKVLCCLLSLLLFLGEAVSLNPGLSPSAARWSTPAWRPGQSEF